MSANVSADLTTLENLYDALSKAVDYAHDLLSGVDTALNNTVWDTPNAQQFKDAWSEFRPGLIRAEMACADAGNDVATNHTQLAEASGYQPDQVRTLSKLTSHDVI